MEKEYGDIYANDLVSLAGSFSVAGDALGEIVVNSLGNLYQRVLKEPSQEAFGYLTEKLMDAKRRYLDVNELEYNVMVAMKNKGFLDEECGGFLGE